MYEMKTLGRVPTAVQVLCPGHRKTQEIQAQELSLLLLVITASCWSINVPGAKWCPRVRPI